MATQLRAINWHKRGKVRRGDQFEVLQVTSARDSKRALMGGMVLLMRSGTKKSLGVARKFLYHSFREIRFDYMGLTKEEKKLCSRAEFEEMLLDFQLARPTSRRR